MNEGPNKTLGPGIYLQGRFYRKSSPQSKDLKKPEDHIGAFVKEIFEDAFFKLQGVEVVFEPGSPCVIVSDKTAWTAISDALPRNLREKVRATKTLGKDRDELEEMILQAADIFEETGGKRNAALRHLGITGNKPGLPDGRLLIFEFLMREAIGCDLGMAVTQITEKYRLQSNEATIKRMQRARTKYKLGLKLPGDRP